jgi:uncharacterized membrane protein
MGPGKQFPALMDLIGNLELGHLIYLTWFGIWGPAAFYGLVAVFAMTRLKWWAASVLLLHYAIGAYRFHTRHPDSGLRDLLTNEAVNYFLEPRAFIFFVLPFLSLNVLIAVLLFRRPPKQPGESAQA